MIKGLLDQIPTRISRSLMSSDCWMIADICVRTRFSRSWMCCKKGGDNPPGKDRVEEAATNPGEGGVSNTRGGGDIPKQCFYQTCISFQLLSLLLPHFPHRSLSRAFLLPGFPPLSSPLYLLPHPPPSSPFEGPQDASTPPSSPQFSPFRGSSPTPLTHVCLCATVIWRSWLGLEPSTP